MKLSILLLSVLITLAVLAVVDAKKKPTPGPCKVKDCTKCNITGKKCKKCNDGFKPKKKGKKCKAIPCAVNPCLNGGECSANRKKEEKCTCKEGFYGDKCQIADPCLPNPCQNGGECTGSGACTCPAGFLGDKCQNKDPCHPNPCKNGGSCSAGSCTCADGFHGDNCENEGQEAVFSLAAETRLEKGKIIGTIPLIEKTYSVSLDIKADSLINAWQSIIHFTEDGDIYGYGYRIPAMWYYYTRNHGYHICGAVNGIMGYCYNADMDLAPPGQWVNVKIWSKIIDHVYKWGFDIDGVEAYSVANNDARAFTNVKIYASDPWFDPLNGQIRNLEVITPL